MIDASERGLWLGRCLAVRAPGRSSKAKGLVECRKEEYRLNGMKTTDPEMGEGAKVVRKQKSAFECCANIEVC